MLRRQFLAAALQQAPQELVFRTGTRLVVHPVTVRDRAGRPVAGLTGEQFTLTEDGVAQKLAFCEYQDLDAPVARAGGAAAAVEAGPQAARLRYQGRRLLVLYFDLSFLGGAELGRALAGAVRFVERDMRPADLASVLVFRRGRLEVIEEFTEERARLRAALERVVRRGEGPLAEAGGFGQNDTNFNLFLSDRAMAALQSAVQRLGSIEGRKALVLFTSGAGGFGANEAQRSALVHAAARANVALFPVDARGLVAYAPAGGITRASDGSQALYTGAVAAAETQALESSQDVLYALGADTGGKALLDQNDLEGGVLLAQRSIASHYLLGYYTSNEATDGRFRRIVVALRGVEHATLEARRGYFAPRDYARMSAVERERQLEEAFAAEDPYVELPLTAAVHYFQLNRAEYFVPVTLRLPGNEIALARRGQTFQADLDVLGEIRDRQGRVVQNLRDQIPLRLDARRAEGFAGRPLDLDSGYTLLPGEYRVKLLVRDRGSGRIGTFLQSFVIPNLNRVEGTLPLSSLVLGQQRTPLGEALFTAGKDRAQGHHPLVEAGRKLVPNPGRTFQGGRPLHLYLEAYGHGAPLVVAAYAGLYRQGERVRELAPARFSAARPGTAGAVPVRLELPLAGLEAGPYECQVTVLDPGRRRAAFLRAGFVIAE